MKALISIVLTIFLLSTVTSAIADDEVTLFDGRGKATACIVFDDGLTIYLWDGKPAAYLNRDSAGGFHVYGFNGKHLGWFVGGVIWDHQGDVSCAVADILQSTQFEPFKSFKQLKPFKSFKEVAPSRPPFSRSFGDTTCGFLLGEGDK
jgi:hypothetical protein